MSMLAFLDAAGTAAGGAGGAGAAGAAGGAGAAGALSSIPGGAGSVPGGVDTMSLIGKLLKGAGESFNREIARNQEYFYEPPKEDEENKQAEEGQKNASGSNAPLDNSLGKEARKTAGVAEGGATPQLDNTVSRDLMSVNRTPTATQALAPKQEGLFTKLSNWWGSDSGKALRNKISSGITSYLNV